jgi:hypothetical protein
LSINKAIKLKKKCFQDFLQQKEKKKKKEKESLYNMVSGQG